MGSTSRVNFHHLWLDSGGKRHDEKINFIIYLLDEIENKVASQPSKESELRVLYFELQDFARSKEDLNLLQLNTNLFTRLIISGLELMGIKDVHNDFLYIGALIDMKIKRMWRESSFYSTISGMLQQIVSDRNFLPEAVKKKIRSEYSLLAPSDYAHFFST
ncbi:hypothetical protein N9B72_01735 [Bacteriovoracaceae bacterium]|nr:hypothetical protein [Bacteriovoracaceae bacterium]